MREIGHHLVATLRSITGTTLRDVEIHLDGSANHNFFFLGLPVWRDIAKVLERRAFAYLERVLFVLTFSSRAYTWFDIQRTRRIYEQLVFPTVFARGILEMKFTWGGGGHSSMQHDLVCGHIGESCVALC